MTTYNYTGSQIINSNGNLGVTTQCSTAFQIQNNSEPVVSFGTDGIVTTKAGEISVDDWVQVIKLMKQFIIDVSQDEETAKKYPYLRDAAHQWMMDELRK